MQKTICAGNWKMYKTPAETRAFFQEFLPKLAELKKPVSSEQIAFFPPHYNLEAAVQSAGGKCSVGAQNVYFEKEGAFTGEVSPIVLQKMGVQYALIGHSERREIFKETDEQCAKKVSAALAAGLIPMLCVGEKLAERESGQTWSVVQRQLDAVFLHLKSDAHIVVAYEPVWAIGTGKVATPDQAEEIHAKIRVHLKGFSLPILYGGSVKPDNAGELIKKPNIDGFLVGGASLKPSDFFAICAAAF